MKLDLRVIQYVIQQHEQMKDENRTDPMRNVPDRASVRPMYLSSTTMLPARQGFQADDVLVLRGRSTYAAARRRLGRQYLSSFYTPLLVLDD